MDDVILHALKAPDDLAELRPLTRIVHGHLEHHPASADLVGT